ncbi:MAG: sodium:proton antiporter [Actinomycetia bacterium]|nr:sodium:proton antiporter [Actinomycetes bacterium]MCP4087416.1 sodium:proton antiporter [Actinomycetes bacterium]
MSGIDIALICGVLLAYALLSRRLAGRPITAPMVFVTAGFVIGPRLLDLFQANVGSADIRLLAELTLALMLFSDAAALDTRRLAREASLPARLLGLALPLSIVLGTALAVVFFPDLLFFEAVALAVLLAPTDAALGQTVVSDTRLPSPVRQGLNVESGLNDGVCVPLLLAAIAFAELEEAPNFDGQVLVDLVEEVAIASAIGVVVAVIVATLSKASIRQGWMEESWGQIVPLIAAATAYAMTVEAGGSGFIASFAAGMLYGRMLGETAHQSTELTEDLGQLLAGVTFLLFGAAMLDRGLSEIDLQIVGYAILSLTVVRMVPVAISLIRSGAKRETVAFAGWFGPRGLATIVFALTIVDESGLEGTRRIVDVATLTVLFSVFAHGLTAPWLTGRYARWLSANRDRLTFETEPVEIGVRTRPPRHRI